MAKLHGNYIKISFLALLCAIPNLSYSNEPERRCHLFLKAATSYVVDLKKYILVKYDSAKFCENSPAKTFHCYSYYEERDTCNSDNEGLINTYIKDLIADGKISP